MNASVTNGMGGTTAAYGQNGSTNQAVMQGFQNGGVYGAIGAGVSNLFNKFPTPNADLNSNNLMMAGIRSSASDAMLLSGNPYAMAAGAAVKIIDKTGGFTDASEGLGSTNDTLNAMSSILLPGAGWFTSPIEKYEVSAATKAMSNSYAGTLKDNKDAAKNSGAKILFGRNLATSKIHSAKAKDVMILNLKNNSDADYETMATMTQSKAMENQYAYTGGYNLALARAGRFGMKIERAKKLAAIEFKPIELVEKHQLGGIIEVKEFLTTSPQQDKDFFASLVFDEIQEFKEGGELVQKNIIESETPKEEITEVESHKEGGSMNVIPEGNLHARLHHMNDADELTKKGVPVVDNEGHQQAEIELNEIIFTLEVTEKLESMYKSFKHYDTSEKEKDEIAIEAGKLLAKEIMENTEDRTGLIELVQ